jgi:hypothetical protein
VFHIIFNTRWIWGTELVVGNGEITRQEVVGELQKLKVDHQKDVN